MLKSFHPKPFAYTPQKASDSSGEGNTSPETFCGVSRRGPWRANKGDVARIVVRMYPVGLRARREDVRAARELLRAAVDFHLVRAAFSLALAKGLRRAGGTHSAAGLEANAKRYMSAAEELMEWEPVGVVL